jgi:hypothetical protein
MQLYEPERHEPLAAAPWDEERARTGVEAIVDATLAAMQPHGLWRTHPDDVDDEDDFVEPTTLWIGASGVILALAQLGADADLAALGERTVARYLQQPDFGDEYVRGLWMGEAGVRLVALRVTGDERHASRLLELVRANATHRSNEMMWGAPGTMIAARAAHALTGDEAFLEAWEESARILLER